MSTIKYASGYEKLKKKKKLIESQNGSMDKRLDLFLELNILKEILQIKDYTPIDILNYIKRLNSFPNTYIAYKILLTIHVIVAYAKRSFSKLKLIKSYLRSTMFQERLSELAILSIEKEMLEKLEYKNLVSQFASQNARKIDFK